MLIDVKVTPRHMRDPLMVMVASIDAGSGNYGHPQTGIYVNHLNFNHEIMSKLGDIHFSTDNDFIVNILKKSIAKAEEEGSKTDYDRKELAAYQRIPSDIEKYYKRDNWKKSQAEDYNEIQTELYHYGVCDDVAQLLSLYDFEADPRKMVILFTEMRREDQSREGGWRWHKWGPYVGLKNPQYEYLHDEHDIESVMVFHIYEVLD